MRQFLTALFVFAGMLVLSSSANAQATRTWVSGVGDDANPCSRTSPCHTFAGAISKTAAGGEINALDSGGYVAVTITKSISIIATGVEAGVLVSGTAGIVVAAGPSDVVVLDGLDVEGLGTSTSGVRVTSANRVLVRNCTIQGFTTNAIDFESSTPNSSLFVEKSLVANNPGGGIYINTVGNSTFNFLLNSTVAGNGNFDLSVNGPSSLSVSGSAIIGPPSTIITSNSGSVVSFGNNLIKNGAPTQTLPLQ